MLFGAICQDLTFDTIWHYTLGHHDQHAERPKINNTTGVTLVAFMVALSLQLTSSLFCYHKSLNSSSDVLI